MCTEQYAKRVANKTNGLVDITLFSLILISLIKLFIFDIHCRGLGNSLFKRVFFHTIPLCVLCPNATQSLVVCMLTSK